MNKAAINVDNNISFVFSTDNQDIHQLESIIRDINDYIDKNIEVLFVKICKNSITSYKNTCKFSYLEIEDFTIGNFSEGFIDDLANECINNVELARSINRFTEDINSSKIDFSKEKMLNFYKNQIALAERQIYINNKNIDRIQQDIEIYKNKCIDLDNN